MLTREYPPDVYGGAGVHVEFLTRQLRTLVDLTVHAWGENRADAVGHQSGTLADSSGIPDFSNATLNTLAVDLSMTAAVRDVDLVHSHTWYANFAGHIAALLYDVPHVVTAHSLEPLRPWKREQLGGGYTVSCWIERTAFEAAAGIIAVSAGMRADLLRCYPHLDPDRIHVVPNGIDTTLYHPVRDREVWTRHGIDPAKPTVLFIGRITRQKGLTHLLRAAREFAPEAQLVICASAADTPELESEITRLVNELRDERTGVFWIQRMLSRAEAIQLLSGATVFACPSVYEPLGIVNLEAMACGTAVVASAVGGIPEVVVNQETGFLVDYDADRPAEFEQQLVQRVNTLVTAPDRAAQFGHAGRERAVAQFGWEAVARRTLTVYNQVRDARARTNPP